MATTTARGRTQGEVEKSKKRNRSSSLSSVRSANSIESEPSSPIPIDWNPATANSFHGTSSTQSTTSACLPSTQTAKTGPLNQNQNSLTAAADFCKGKFLFGPNRYVELLELGKKYPDDRINVSQITNHNTDNYKITLLQIWCTDCVVKYKVSYYDKLTSFVGHLTSAVHTRNVLLRLETEKIMSNNTKFTEERIAALKRWGDHQGLDPSKFPWPPEKASSLPLRSSTPVDSTIASHEDLTSHNTAVNNSTQQENRETSKTPNQEESSSPRNIHSDARPGTQGSSAQMIEPNAESVDDEFTHNSPFSVVKIPASKLRAADTKANEEPGDQHQQKRPRLEKRVPLPKKVPKSAEQVAADIRSNQFEMSKPKQNIPLASSSYEFGKSYRRSLFSRFKSNIKPIVQQPNSRPQNKQTLPRTPSKTRSTSSTPTTPPPPEDDTSKFAEFAQRQANGKQKGIRVISNSPPQATSHSFEARRRLAEVRRARAGSEDASPNIGISHTSTSTGLGRGLKLPAVAPLQSSLSNLQGHSQTHALTHTPTHTHPHAPTKNTNSTLPAPPQVPEDSPPTPQDSHLQTSDFNIIMQRLEKLEKNNMDKDVQIASLKMKVGLLSAKRGE